MRMKLWSWTARTFAVGAMLAVACAAPPTFAQAPAQVSTSAVLTEDIIVRVLGMEKDNNPFTLPESTDPDATAKAAKVNKVRDAFAGAIIDFQQGNAQAAEAKLKAARAEDNSLSHPSVYLARLCFAVNDPNLVKVGRAFLDRAENEDDSAPEPYMMLGNLALLEGRLADANLNFRQALSLVTMDKDRKWSEKQKNTFLKNVYGGLVSVNEQRGNWVKGLIDIDNWIALDPNDPVATYRKARLEFMKDPTKNTETARKLFEDAYKFAEDARGNKPELPSVPPAELALLELQTQTNNLDAARAEIEKIDTKFKAGEFKNPKEGSRVNSTVSQWYLGQGKFADAQKYAQAAAALDADSPAIKQLTAVLEYFANDLEAAEKSFTKLNQEAPDDMFAANYLALVLVENPKKDEAKIAKAVRIAELSARLNPKSPVALGTLGWCYYKAGRLGEAAQIFAALEQEKNLQISADMAYYMAEVYGALPVSQFPNGIGRARDLLEKVVSTKGPFKHRDDAIAQYLAFKGDPKNVIAADAPTANKEITPKTPTPPATTPAPATTPPATTTPPTTPSPNGGN
jgi:tetratricopeptide (TPR) repeat protein